MLCLAIMLLMKVSLELRSEERGLPHRSLTFNFRWLLTECRKRCRAAYVIFPLCGLISALSIAIPIVLFLRSSSRPVTTMIPSTSTTSLMTVLSTSRTTSQEPETVFISQQVSTLTTTSSSQPSVSSPATTMSIVDPTTMEITETVITSQQTSTISTTVLYSSSEPAQPMTSFLTEEVTTDLSTFADTTITTTTTGRSTTQIDDTYSCAYESPDEWVCEWELLRENH